MVDVNMLYSELDSYVRELAEKFVDDYIPANPTASPSDYSHDVKAYCVLAHAGFEEFIEAVVLAVVDHSIDQWITTRRANEVVMALLCWYGATLKIDNNENAQEIKPFDYLRPLVVEAKAAFSNHVFKNHGVSILYLRNLLIPVAIEITQDANLLNSLRKLAEGRGDYAHKGRAKMVLAPEDAKRYVEDILILCDGVRAKALLKLT